MGTVPSPYTWANGDKLNFRDMQQRVHDVLTFMMNPPMIRLRKTVAQNISTSTTTALNWDLVETETENMWDATLPSRLKPQTPGWYIGSAGASFDDNVSGYRELSVRKNGGSTRSILVKNDGFPQSGATTTFRGNSFVEQFNGTTDYIESVVFQTSGVTLSVQVTALDGQPDLSLRWFAPL